MRHTIRRLVALGVALLLTHGMLVPAHGILLPTHGILHAQESALPTLSMMETVSGSITASMPDARWQYRGQEGERISLLARPLSGDLDPVLQILDDSGRQLAQADDIAYPDRLAAALEGFEIPRDGDYTIRVTRFEQENGTTTGDFTLSLLPAYAAPVFVESFDGAQDWQAGNGSLAEANFFEGKLLLELDTANALGWASPVAAPQVPLSAYVQVNAAVTNDPDYWEFGIILRQVSPTSYYLFSVSGRGDWAFLARSGGSTWIHIQDWTAHPALADLNKAARLGVLMQENTFTFFVNGQELGQVTADVILEPGEIALSTGTIDRQQTFPFVTFDNLLITEPLPVDGDGVAGQTLETWQALDGAAVVAELVASEIVSPGGEQVMLVPSSFTSVSRAGINTLALGQGRTQADFVLGTSVTMESEGAGNGCGVFFRQEAEEQYGLAFLDGLGGVGLAFRREGLFEPSSYVDAQFDALEAVRLLVVGQGGEVRAYVNGTLVALQSHAVIEGVLGIAALSYDGQFTNCRFADTWLWAWN